MRERKEFRVHEVAESAVVSPPEIRNAEEAGLQRNHKCVRFGDTKGAVPVRQSVCLFWNSGERSGQMTQTEFTNV